MHQLSREQASFGRLFGFGLQDFPRGRFRLTPSYQYMSERAMYVRNASDGYRQRS